MQFSATLVEDSNIPYKAFGDENETLLGKALDIMGVQAGEGGRLAATKKATRFISESLRDNIQLRDRRMIKDNPLKLVNK